MSPSKQLVLKDPFPFHTQIQTFIAIFGILLGFGVMEASTILSVYEYLALDVRVKSRPE